MSKFLEYLKEAAGSNDIDESFSGYNEWKAAWSERTAGNATMKTNKQTGMKEVFYNGQIIAIWDDEEGEGFTYFFKSKK